MRQTVKCKDVQEFLGKSKETGYKVLREIREHLHKEARHPITIQEFDAYYKLINCGIAATVKAVDDLIESKKLPKLEKSFEIHNNKVLPYAFAKKQ